MRSRISVVLTMVVGAISLYVASPALATNGHQDHQGACARSTTSINAGVNDLQFNGVAGRFAGMMGIHSLNGSPAWQLKHQLVIATVAKTTVTHNRGCDGHGGVFGAGSRRLYKGEKVAVKRPARFSASDICKHSHKGCKRVTFVVHVALPGSCWNANTGTIRVVIFVHRHKHHKPKPAPKPVPKPVVTPKGSCNGNNSGAQNGNCSAWVCSGIDNCNVVTPPQPCTSCNQTPPTMQVKNVTSPQEADNDGETYPNLFADAYTPNGDSITCTVGVADPNDHSQSGFGSISGTRSFTFTSHGYDRVGPYTYQAPNDGTGDVVGQYDQIEVTCHDNSDRSVQDAQGFSKPFQITAAPGNPA